MKKNPDAGKRSSASSEPKPTKTLLYNKRASFEYHFFDHYEAGIALVGTEVKSIRAGKVQLQDAWAGFNERGVLQLHQLHIDPYSHGNLFNHSVQRIRALLLNKRELLRIADKLSNQGFSLIPIRIYLKGNKIKVELVIVRGKKLYDKRESTKEREVERDLQRYKR